MTSNQTPKSRYIDGEGNPVCPDCMAHCPRGLQEHRCYGVMTMLVGSMKRERPEEYEAEMKKYDTQETIDMS